MCGFIAPARLPGAAFFHGVSTSSHICRVFKSMHSFMIAITEKTVAGLNNIGVLRAGDASAVMMFNAKDGDTITIQPQGAQRLPYNP